MTEIFVGIDPGSTTVKAVAMDGKVLASAIRPTGANPRKAGETVLEQGTAAGTGRFIENIAMAPEVSIDEFARRHMVSQSPASINNVPLLRYVEHLAILFATCIVLVLWIVVLIMMFVTWMYEVLMILTDPGNYIQMLKYWFKYW